MAGRTVISVLGPPRVERDGSSVAFDTRKATALLAFLAVTGRPQRRETLAALLWPEADEVRARSALRRTLSVLKRGLGEPALLVTRDELALVDGGEVVIDVRAFLAGVGSPDLEEVAGAAGLWRGDLLDGFSLRDSPAFDDWQARETERLRRVMSTASSRLVEAHLAAGRTDDAVVHAERWLALDPLHEPAHRALMRLHASRGDRAAAVQQYRACVRIVDEELGVAPLEETTSLYEAIATGSLGAPAPVPPAAPAPMGAYPMVGRTAEAARVAGALGPGGLVVVEGEPGVGKTRLVDEVLQRRSGRALVARCYEHDGDVPYGPIVEVLRQAAADLAAAGDLAALPDACRAEAARLVPELRPEGTAPGFEGPGADTRFLDGVARTVMAAAGGSAGVLVVDDAQWADHATQQVLAHIAHRGGADAPCLVLTLRSGEVADAGPLAPAVAERLRRPGATAVRLDRLDLAAVTELVSGALAGERAREVADEVARESEGLPFLVVAYLDAAVGGQTTSASVGDLLHSRLASLSDGGAQLLATASVIGRSFSLDVVRRASGRSDEEAVAGIDELVARRLVLERDHPGGPRYDFAHDHLRRFVYDDTSLARRRLLHHRVAEAILADLGRDDDPAALAAAVGHHEREAGHDDRAADHFLRAGRHARAVHANADARGHFEAALALGHPEVGALHEEIGDLETLDGRFADAVASYERAAARADGGDLSRLERKLGGVHQRLGHWEIAERHHRSALDALGDDQPSERARVTADLAVTAVREGDTARAGALAAEAVSLAEHAGDDAALAHTGTVAGLLAAGRGEDDTARWLLTRSLELAEALGDPAAVVAAANGLARVERTAGDLDRAEGLLRDAVARCVAIGDRHREAALRDQLAQVLHQQGDAVESMAELKAAVAIFADIGVEGGSVQTEVWRLTEWVDQSLAPSRNDLGTLMGDNGGVPVDHPAGDPR